MAAPIRHVPVGVRWVTNRGVGGGRSGGGCRRSGKGGFASGKRAFVARSGVNQKAVVADGMSIGS